MNTRQALLLALAGAPVCMSSEALAADLVPIEWGADGRFARELPLPAGKFVEVCGPLSKGAKVEWTFDAGVATDFNIHYHEGKEVRFPAQQRGVAKAAGRLDVEVQQDYCWMWTSKSPGAATLKLELKRGG